MRRRDSLKERSVGTATNLHRISEFLCRMQLGNSHRSGHRQSTWDPATGTSGRALPTESLVRLGTWEWSKRIKILHEEVGTGTWTSLKNAGHLGINILEICLFKVCRWELHAQIQYCSTQRLGDSYSESRVYIPAHCERVKLGCNIQGKGNNGHPS